MCLAELTRDGVVVEHRVYMDVSVVEAAEPGTIPFAIFNGTQNGFAAALLIARLIPEGWPSGDIVLPQQLLSEINWNPGEEIPEPEKDGNIGVIDDSKTPRLLDQSGHVIVHGG